MTKLAKSIIDNLSGDKEPVDLKHHAEMLHKHSGDILDSISKKAPHTAETLMAFEHAYKLMQSLDHDIGDGENDVMGDEDADIVDLTTESLTDLNPDHRFVVCRPDQLASNYGFSGRKLQSFHESFVTEEEAYTAAKALKARPLMIAEVMAHSDTEGYSAQLRYMITDDTDNFS
jgi:hypothetical protein